MKSIFYISFLGLFGISIGIQAQEITPKVTLDNDIMILPSALTTDSKSKIIVDDPTTEETATGEIKIYDKNLSHVKTIQVQKSEIGNRFRVVSKTHPKEIFTITNKYYEKRGVFPENELQENIRYYDSSMIIDENETWFYMNSDCEYSEFGGYARNTPRYAYCVRKNTDPETSATNAYEYGNVNVEYDKSFSTEIVTIPEEDNDPEISYDNVPELNIMLDGVEYDDLPVTQNIFNKDDKYEYIRLMYKTIQFQEDLRDYDGDGIEESYNTVENSVISGIEIVSEDGTILNTIAIDNYTGHYVDLGYIQVEDQNYLVVTVDGESDDYSVTFYEINQTSSALKKVLSTNKSKVYPNPVKSGESISVDLPNTEHDKTITLVATNGKKVYQKTLKKDVEKTVIPLNSLNSGVYEFIVSSNNQKISTNKMIVR